MDSRIKNLVKDETWNQLCEEIVTRIKLANLEPLPTETPTDAFREACRREGRGEIIDILKSIQTEAFKEEKELC